MSSRVGRREPRPLTAGSDASLAAVRSRLRCCRASYRRFVVAVSPWHFDRGDMRGAYRLTRTVFDVLAVLLALVAGRLALTGLFVSLVTTRPALVAAFNLGVSLLAGCLLAAATVGRARLARRRRRAAARLDRL